MVMPRRQLKLVKYWCLSEDVNSEIVSKIHLMAIYRPIAFKKFASIFQLLCAQYEQSSYSGKEKLHP